jgi:hypothetical protein
MIENLLRREFKLVFKYSIPQSHSNAFLKVRALIEQFLPKAVSRSR